MPVETFKGLRDLRIVKLDSFSLCCYATLYHKDVQCDHPSLEGSALSSCNRMIEAPGPRQSIWLLGILAVFGNLAVIAWRLIRRDDHPVQTCLLTNLAVSDFLMGVYLMIIAIKDQLWAGAYFSFDLIWRSGNLCKVAGALSVLSSEVSVLMLTVITADRLISIVFAFSCSRLTLKGTYVICTVVWICGTVIAVVPAFDTPYFYNVDRRYGFYGRSSVCLPLQLSAERLAGWEYSVGVFIALNLAAFLFIMVAYVAIVAKVSKSQRRVKAHGESEVSSNSIKRESALARRVFAIILTDFSCWVPVIILSILALTGQFHDEQGFVYVWFAVFVLPVNSSVNPVLYTFSTPKVRSVFKDWFYRIFHRCTCICCKMRSSSHRISGSDERVTQLETLDNTAFSMDVSVTQLPNDNLQQNGNIMN
ncbi:G-protein coupled receptor GRL101-like [Oculina patagonica]